VKKLKPSSTSSPKLVKSLNTRKSSRDKEIQNAMQTLKNHKVIESNAKLIKKNGKQLLVLSSNQKISKVSKSLNDMMKNSKLLASTTKPVVNFSNGKNFVVFRNISQ
jgi:RNA polymerase-interacting CarD/CdnL/TRCF family regulator